MLEASRRKYYSEEKLRSFLNTKNNDGITALHFSVQSKNLELVKRLVYAGADVNACDSVGVTPLHLAADFQECAAFLISKVKKLHFSLFFLLNSCFFLFQECTVSKRSTQSVSSYFG